MLDMIGISAHWLASEFSSHPRLMWMGTSVIGFTTVGGVLRKFRRSRRAKIRHEELAGDARQDHALRGLDGDKLDRGPFVDNLVRALVRTTLDDKGKVSSCEATGFVIGLTGAWGLGKSSILNILHKRLSATPHVAVALLNPWLFKDRDELLKAYFNGLRDALGTSSDEKVRSLLVELERYQRAIDWVGKTTAALISAHWPGASLLNAVWAKIGASLMRVKAKAPRSPDEERRALEHKIALAKVAVVVLIDDWTALKIQKCEPSPNS